MADIWAYDGLKIATLGLIIFLFVALPFLQRKIASQQPAQYSTVYKKNAANIYVQTLLLLAPAIVVAVRGLLNGNLTEAIASSFLFICLFGGLGSMWTVWQARDELQAALATSNNVNRARRLADVAEKWKFAAVSAAISVGIGACGLIYVQFTSEQPSWFWFVVFLFTLSPVQARAWSLAVLGVASRYGVNSGKN